MTNLDTEPAPLPPPTPVTSGPHERRWARSDDRVVLGVAGGLAQALAIEPLIVRLAFVVLVLFGGVGIVLYIAGLALLADSPTSEPPSTVRRVLGAIALVVSARWLFSGNTHLPKAGWVVAIVLFGVAAALWRGRSPIVDATPPVESLTEPLAGVDGGSTTSRWASLTARRRERPRRPRSALGLLTIGIATVVGALAWLANNGATNRGTIAFGWATVVLGAGLVVGSVVGRARWLILPALVTATAAVAAAAMSFAGVGLTNRAGSRTEVVGPGGTVAAEYRTGLGSFELWLIDHPNDVTTTVEVGVGDLTVVVPDDAQVQIDAKIGMGTIDALGSTRSGYRRTLNLDTRTGKPLIKLTLRVGVGSIDVRRASSTGNVPVLPKPGFEPDIPALRYFSDGTVLFKDGSIDFGDGRRIEADGSYQVPIVEQRPDGSVQLDNGAVIRADGSVVSPGGFLILPGAPSPLPTSLDPLPSPSNTTIAQTTTTEVQP